jgi:hypothetical protein
MYRAEIIKNSFPFAKCSYGSGYPVSFIFPGNIINRNQNESRMHLNMHWKCTPVVSLQLVTSLCMSWSIPVTSCDEQSLFTVAR